MPQSIFIDNNIWDFLFARNLDLSVELPSSRYSIGITREAEFEIPPIKERNPELELFIEQQRAKCKVVVDTYFGFEESTIPSDEQRVAGFGHGRWASQKETEFIAAQNRKMANRNRRKNEKTKLHKEEADVALAARSFDSIVLSLDAKEGPILDARRSGGQVVFLTNFDARGKSLKQFIDDELQNLSAELSLSS